MCAMNVADWIEVLTSKEHWRIQNIEEGWGRGQGCEGGRAWGGDLPCPDSSPLWVRTGEGHNPLFLNFTL